MVIFITVGTQKFQFNRLLKEIDRLILFGSYAGNDEEFIEIFLNGVSVKNIKIKLVNKSNIWPNSSEIIFEKHN